MSVHTILHTSSQLVCGLVHTQSGSTCLRHADHVGQHVFSHEGVSGLWVKDPLSCKCGGRDMCPGQKCVVSWPVGEPVAQKALTSKDWTWEGAL
jgi:hypothetical protein